MTVNFMTLPSNSASVKVLFQPSVRTRMWDDCSSEKMRNVKLKECVPSSLTLFAIAPSYSAYFKWIKPKVCQTLTKRNETCKFYSRLQFSKNLSSMKPKNTNINNKSTATTEWTDWLLNQHNLTLR